MSPGEASFEKWNHAQSVAQAFQIGIHEARAALNLKTKCCEQFVQLMSDAVATHGMKIITHEAIGGDAIVLGGGGIPNSPWNAQLRTTEAIQVLLAKRIISDYEALPKSMRKSFGPKDVVEKQRVCAVFMMAMNAFKEEVSDAAFAEEEGGLHERFRLQYLDSELLGLVDATVPPVDLSAISAFRLILQRRRQAKEAERAMKHAELAARLARATIESIRAEVEEDWEAADKYLNEMRLNKEVEEAKDLNYVRQRYLKGTEMVAERMQERLSVRLVPNLAAGPVEYSSMKMRLDTLGAGKAKDACEAWLGTVGLWHLGS